MAYTNQPRTNPRDAIRLLVGDVSTSTSREYLSDVDYDFFISACPNNYSAAALACNSLAAVFGGAGSKKKVGDLEITRADAAYYRDLAKQLQRMSALQSAPYAGGISVSDKDTQRGDTDQTRPSFERDQFTNPSAVSPTGST